MRRANHLFPRILEHENLLRAYHGARRGKRDRWAVQEFERDLQGNLAVLRRRMEAHPMVWLSYRMFEVRDPKPRRIAAPAFPDRVAHHAIMQVIEPELERVAIWDSYACRRGKGLHRGIQRAQSYARRYPWFLQLDVRKYFDSVDHRVLKDLLARRFKDRALLSLLGSLIDSYAKVPGKGIPIGSLTSQHFANFYLAPLDHYAKEVLGARGFVRYMDDFVLFAETKAELLDARSSIEQFLRERLALELKNAGALDRTASGVGFLGLLVRPSHVRLMGKTKRRVRAKWKALVEQYRGGQVDAGSLARRATALLVRTRQVKARGLRQRWLFEFGDFEA